jgi:hypothetical protein
LTPKVLAIDVETSPHLGYFWDTRGVWIADEQIIDHSHVICFAAQWEHERDKGDRGVKFYSEFHHGPDKMYRAMFDLLSEADILLHFNGARFDEKKMQGEFAERQMGKPAPSQRIDLYQTARSQFGYNSNKLDDLLARFGLRRKVRHEGIKLWIDCHRGDPKAWARMRRYNKGDIPVLFALKDHILPWIKGMPNAALYADGVDGMCPAVGCGSLDTVKEGRAYSKTRIYQRYHCKNCGTWFQGTKSIGSVEVTTVAA